MDDYISGHMAKDFGAPAYLGVSASLTGRRWIGLEPDAERLADRMVQETGLPHAVARVLARLGVAPEAAEDYLSPRLRDLLPDPHRLKDMEPAAARRPAAASDPDRLTQWSPKSFVA